MNKRVSQRSLRLRETGSDDAGDNQREDTHIDCWNNRFELGQVGAGNVGNQSALPDSLPRFREGEDGRM